MSELFLEFGPKSQQILQRGLAVTASQRRDLDSVNHLPFAKGLGSKIWDYDGREYLDLTSSTGAIIIGYADKRVDEAARVGASRGGHLPSQLTDVQIDLAERVIGLMPCAERVLFFKTGSDACTAAIRLCRQFKGKQKILSSGYHGWHDWQLNLYPNSKFKDDSVVNFGYNLNYLERELESTSDYAAIIVTPEPNFFPDDYWHELREIANTHDVLLAFDEVMTGFRYGLSGFHGRLGVEPDLVAASKGLANGYAVAVLAGKEDVINSREKTHMWSTYNGDMAAFYAALETIKICENENVPQVLHDVGTHFINGIQKLIKEFGMRAEVLRHPPVFHILFQEEQLWQSLHIECFKRGLLLSRFDSQVIMASHSIEDMDFALAVMWDSLKSLRKENPSYFDNDDTSVSQGVLNRRTYAEFGGRVQYRAPISTVPRKVIKLQ